MGRDEPQGEATGAAGDPGPLFRDPTTGAAARLGRRLRREVLDHQLVLATFLQELAPGDPRIERCRRAIRVRQALLDDLPPTAD